MEQLIAPAATGAVVVIGLAARQWKQHISGNPGAEKASAQKGSIAADQLDAAFLRQEARVDEKTIERIDSLRAETRESHECVDGMRAQIAALEKRSEVHNQHTVRHTLQKISGSLVGLDYILEARAHRERHGAGG